MLEGTGCNMQGLYYVKVHFYAIQIFAMEHITFHETDAGFGELFHQATHEELAAKILCTNEGTVF